MTTRWLIILATVCWGIWGFALKKATHHLSPLAAYVAYAAVNLLLVPIYAGLARAWDVPLRFSRAGAAWVVLAAACVGIGTVALLYALRDREASGVVALTATYPLVTLLLAVLLLGEEVSLVKVSGIALVVGGVYLLTR